MAIYIHILLGLLCIIIIIIIIIIIFISWVFSNMIKSIYCHVIHLNKEHIILLTMSEFPNTVCGTPPQSDQGH